MKHLPLAHLLLLSLLLLAGCGNNAPVPPPPEPSPTPSPVPGPVDPGPVPSPTPGPVPGPTPDPTPPPPSGDGISGILFAASGGDVAGTQIYACAVVNQSDEDELEVLDHMSFDCSAPSTVGTTISASGSSAPYSLATPAGDYVVVARQDVNDDGTFDYFGGYGYDPASDTFQIVASPAQGIDVTLQAVGAADPGPTPPPPSGEGISGTIFAPSGWDVVGTLVSACVVRESDGYFSYDCNDPSTVETVIMESGPSASYTLPAPADAYVVLALQDGDFDFDADYEGGYGYDPASGNYEIVIAPAQGIDITLIPVDSGSSGVSGNQPHRMVKGSLSHPLYLPVALKESL